MSVRFLALTAAIALVCACGGGQKRRPGEEYLRAVEFEGNRTFSDGTLGGGLALQRTQRRARAPDPYQVQLDAQRVQGHYQRNGFFETTVQTRVEKAGDATTVTYAIEEGTRSATRVRITGLPADVPMATVRAKLPLEEGGPFDYEKYDLAKQDVVAVLQDHGYAHAKLAAHVTGDVATHTALVELDFVPGPKCKFGTVTVSGVDGALRDAVIERLQFEQGQMYSTAAVTATQRQLYGMGRFSSVQVQPDRDEEDVIDVKVAVSEGAPRQVTLGAGIGMDPISFFVRGRAGYEVQGWPFPLDKATLDLRPAYAYLRDGSGLEPRMRALAKLERQDLFMTYAVGSVSASFNYLAYEAFTEYGPEARLDYAFQLGTPRLRVNLGYVLHQFEFRNISQALDPTLRSRLGVDRPELVGGFRQQIVADFRDKVLSPTSGAYASFEIIEGTRLAGSDYEFQQITPEVRGYLSLGPIVLAARGRYSAIYGDIPPTHRFYGGGAIYQRGFGERGLSPFVVGEVDGELQNVAYGGGALADGSVEVRFPIWEIKKMPLNGVVFTDIGDVVETPGDLDVDRFHIAAGIGLRLVTIVGPVRVDLGRRLNRTGPMDPEPSSNFAFHLSLGEAF